MAVIDLRGYPTEKTQNIRAIKTILDIMGQAEGVRQQRQQLMNLTQNLQGGMDMTGALETASNMPAQNSGGLSGVMQSIGSIANPYKFQQSPLDELAMQNAQTEMKYNQPYFRNQVQSRTEATRSRDLENLYKWSKLSSELEEGDPMRSMVQSVISEHPGKAYLPENDEETDTAIQIESYFPQLMKGQKKEFRKNAFVDKVYGDEAYQSALQEAVERGARHGLQPQDITQKFEKWWDQQHDEKRGNWRQEYANRQSFKTRQAPTTENMQSEQKAGNKELTPQEAEAILDEAGQDVEKARSIARERGYTF